MLVSDIGIDLGTASVLVYVRGKGIVLNEPSVVAYDKDTNEIQAVGEEARLMIGRTPENITAVKPLCQGVISDYRVTEKMLKYFIDKALKRKNFKKPRLSICVPSGATEVEKRAVVDAAIHAGARDVRIVEEPIAGAIGAGIDISRPVGSLIADIGGGTTDIAVISMNDTVISTSVKVAGDNFDEALVRYIKKKHNMLIGVRTAEEIKMNVGCVKPFEKEKTVEVRGRNELTGLPKVIQFSSFEAMEALQPSADMIISGIRSILEQTPPELAADIAKRGIILTGGGSLLYGLDQMIEENTGIKTTVAKDPMSVVAIGTGCYSEVVGGQA